MEQRSVSPLIFAVGGVALLAIAMPTWARDPVIAWDPGAVVEFETTITEVREAPAGDALPGLHLDAKVDGRATDIYIAPMDFVRQFEVSFAAGDSVWVTGSRIRASGKDIVLAREISTGLSNRKTLYLRDSHGPFWSAGTGRQ